MNKKNNMFLRTAALVRCSHIEQKLHGYTVEHQTKALKKYAEENGLVISKWYIDEAKSASKNQNRRTAFQEMMKDIKAGKVDFIIMTKFDRFFRDIRSFYRTLDVLDKHGVSFSCTEERIDNHTPEGKESLHLRVVFAEMESRRISDRVKFTLKNMVADKKPIGAQPFGYRIEGEERNKRVVKDEAKEEIVNDIFDYFELHRNKRATAKYISEKYDFAFSYKTLTMILTSEYYTGNYQGVEEYAPAYISKERYDRIQKILKKNVKATKESATYIFSGLVVCGHCGTRCGGSFSKGTGGKQGKKYKMYRCCRFNNFKACDNKSNASELKIEKYLLENIIDEMEKYQVKAKVAEAEKKKPTVNKNAIKSKITRTQQMYRDGFMEYDTFVSEMKALNESLAKAEAEEKQHETRDLTPVKQLLESGFMEVYDTMSEAEKAVFWGKVIGDGEIRVYSDKTVRVFF